MFNYSELPVVSDMAGKHIESVSGLIHRDHMASIKDAQELKLTELAHLTSSLTIFGDPGLVVLLVKHVFVLPLGGEGPGLSATPVANPVLIT